MAPTFTLPDFFVDWPFQRTENIHYDESVAIASKEWVEDYKVFDTKAQESFNGMQVPLLASLTYPKVGPSHLRGACDFLNWLFVVDELSDATNGVSSRELTARLMEIFCDPSKPLSGQTALEKMTASFWSRCIEYAHPVSAKRFVDSITPYIESLYEEAEDRDHHRVRTIEEYLTLRRHTAGSRPTLYFIMLEKELPEEVTNHPLIERLTLGAVDMIILCNDVISFNFERSLGLDNHNMVSVVMAEKGLDVQGAVDYVAKWYHDEAKMFLEIVKNLPSFGEVIDPVLAEYIFGLGNWVVGYLEWSFVSSRYFGVGAPELRTKGMLEVLPRKLEEDSASTM